MALHVVLAGHGEIYERTEIDIPDKIGVRYYVDQAISAFFTTCWRVQLNPTGNHRTLPRNGAVGAGGAGKKTQEHCLYDMSQGAKSFFGTAPDTALEFTPAYGKAVLLSEFLTWIDGKRAELFAPPQPGGAGGLGLMANANDDIIVHWTACRARGQQPPERALGVGMRLCVVNGDLADRARKLAVLAPSQLRGDLTYMRSEAQLRAEIMRYYPRSGAAWNP